MQVTMSTKNHEVHDAFLALRRDRCASFVVVVTLHL